MNYKNFLFIFYGFVLFAFIGCSGKVQTNPLPQDKAYVLPDIPMQLRSKVQIQDVIDFDSYAREFFMKRKYGDFEKSIWQIGLEREHYKGLGEHGKKYKK